MTATREIYNSLAAKLGNRQTKKIANNTYLEAGTGYVQVRLHDTVILTSRPREFELNSGGYKTKLTAERINSIINPHFYLSSVKGIWVMTGDDIRWATKLSDGFVFKDGIRIRDNWFVKSSAGTLAYARRQNALKARIRAYAAECVASLPLAQPSGGDCWGCYFVKKEYVNYFGMENPKCTNVMGTDHFISHMKEHYVVPSLVYNALLNANAAQAVYYGAFGEAETYGSTYYHEFAKRNASRAIYKWIARNLGVADLS